MWQRMGRGMFPSPQWFRSRFRSRIPRSRIPTWPATPPTRRPIALAERDIFVGEQMGETWFFRPEAPVTREEFLAMAMDVVGLETLPEATMTGFADDDSISVWAKPYVASALRAGMVQGSGGDGDGAEFAPDRVITQTEAAVMLNRLLQVSDVAATGALSQDAAPPGPTSPWSIWRPWGF